jgi:hypothetical protein
VLVVVADEADGEEAPHRGARAFDEPLHTPIIASFGRGRND